MSSVLDNYHDADGQAIQPYYAAFMIEFGARTVEEAQAASIELEGHRNLGFMFWIQKRWAEYEAAHGLKRNGQRGLYRSEFDKWLESRALDRLARDCIEAA